MKAYHSHILLSKNEKNFIEKLNVPEVNFKFITDPSKRYWEFDDEKGSTILEEYYDDFKLENKSPYFELIIEAKNEEMVEDFLSLVQSGLLLGTPDYNLVSNFVFPSDFKEDNLTYYLKKPFSNYLKRFESIKLGFKVAELTLFNKTIAYSLEKLKISHELESVNPYNVDPRYGQYYDNESKLRLSHTKRAFSIIAAFSVVEELGLEIRSSRVNPRFKNKDSGEWNPKVFNEIENRLNEANIPLNLTVDWVYRGTPTRIENDIKPFFGFDSEWTVYGDEVRDKTLTIIEAIHNASYLRNFIASHKFNELTALISPYDVFNVQEIARKLILHRLNLWNDLNKY